MNKFEGWSSNPEDKVDGKKMAELAINPKESESQNFDNNLMGETDDEKEKLSPLEKQSKGLFKKIDNQYSEKIKMVISKIEYNILEISEEIDTLITKRGDIEGLLNAASEEMLVIKRDYLGPNKGEDFEDKNILHKLQVELGILHANIAKNGDEGLSNEKEISHLLDKIDSLQREVSKYERTFNSLYGDEEVKIPEN